MEKETKQKHSGSWVGTGRPGPGRPKGVPNKASRVAKDAIWAVFDGLGGEEAMLAWARENQTQFYASVWPRILPKPVEVSGPDGGPVEMTERTLKFVESGK